MRTLVNLATALLLVGATATPASLQAQAEEQETPTADVAGEWEITYDTPRGTAVWRVTFEQDGTKLTGEAELRFGTRPIRQGSVRGNDIEFVLEFSGRGRTMQLRFTGTVEGDSMSGTMTGPRGGAVSWTGRRLGSL